MTDLAVFGTYATKRQVELAVDQIIQDGFNRDDLSVLFPENQTSREFVQEKQTRAPEGISSGPAAEVPLAGTIGITEPSIGPVHGALSGALVGMASGSFPVRLFRHAQDHGWWLAGEFRADAGRIGADWEGEGPLRGSACRTTCQRDETFFYVV